MAIKNLTEKMVARLGRTPTGGAQSRYFDQVQPNLLLKVGAKTKTFYWIGRNPRGRQVEVKLGPFPTLSLDEAREECRTISKRVIRGVDPKRKYGGDMTGEDLVNELTSHATWKFDRSEGRADLLNGYLRRSFIPECGDMMLEEIHSGHLLDIIESYQSEGKMGAASHMWCALSVLWQFAIVRRYVKMSPMYGIKSPKPNAPRDRVLSDGELKHIWNALGAGVRQPVEHALAIRLLMLLPFRGMELIHGEWSEIDFEEANWVIPRRRIKTRSSGGGPFLMPLPPMALSLLEMLHSSAEDGKWLFPTRKGDGPIDVRVIGRFISRNREKGIFEGTGKWNKHTLRRTIATNMGKLGVDWRIIGGCLSHKQPGVTGLYVLYGYRKEKLAALTLWQRHLEKIIR